MRLLLIRHGQTIDNVRGELGTVIPGPPLTDLGHAQAEALPAALAEERIEAIYTSVMQRTQLTARPLSRATGVPTTVIEGIHEISAGEYEARADREAIHAYLATIFSWWESLEGRLPGGESGAEFSERYTRAIDTIASRHSGTVAVVSHGAAIRTWASWIAHNVDAEFSRAHDLANTGVVALEGSPAAGWVVTEWAGEPVGGPQWDDRLAADPIGH
ncbi:histidine phosphatase family protein [Galbitalea soli]|uniref:Histidine phosphatase family protein n=1 Tax=Galbitalea soli TaxID=1268042 RepID=A0A7C9PPP9_9MICO|nr:histidine phosphatase family protein [Galbitalea soli]NEM92427.1 histidine phosphatase family protein [Galbitalea soli]NYJ29462.1 putative phosphoglycerate mutase [Galbitalea soli]